MVYGILLLRVVLGLTLAGHGAQKLFGIFGGPGPRGTASFFGGLRFRAPFAMALLAGAAELGGGLLVTFGLATPLGALVIAIVMVTAVGSVHLKNGFWAGNGGYEFNLLIWAAAVTIAATGPLRFSLDRLLGWDARISGLWWGVGVATASLMLGALNLTLRRAAAAPAQSTLQKVS
jgi:putative oxidoreductase